MCSLTDMCEGSLRVNCVTNLQFYSVITYIDDQLSWELVVVSLIRQVASCHLVGPSVMQEVFFAQVLIVGNC